MATDTKRGWHGPRRCAGAGATVCVEDQRWWEGDAYHTEMEKKRLPVRKK
jgi:hypothetical protein